MKKIVLYTALFVLLLPLVTVAQSQQDEPNIATQVASVQQVEKEIDAYIELKKEHLENRERYFNIYLLIVTVFVTVFVTLVGVAHSLILNREHRKAKEVFDDIKKAKENFEEKFDKELQNIEKEKEKIQEFETEQRKQKELNDKYIEAQKLQLSSQNNDVQNYKNNFNQIMNDLQTAGIDLSDCKYKLINDWGKALNSFSLEKYKEAENEFQQLLKKYPNELNMIDISNVYRLLSVCYLVQNDKERALSFAESAVLLNPNNYLAWNNKGVALEEFADKQEEALQCYDVSIKLCPTVDNVWYNKGSVLDDLNRKEDTLYALNRCLEITPDYDLALVLKGCILISQKDKKGAAECFNKIDPLRVQKKQLEEIQRVFEKYKQNKEYEKFLKIREMGQIG